MQIEYRTGDLLEAAEPVIVHGCNAQGSMGAGVARAIRDRYPAAYAAYRAAHEAYLADRALLGDVPEIAGISAGGMPTRVKCLHVLVGHALAAGPGVNPFGDEVLARIGDVCGAAHPVQEEQR